MSTNFLEQRLNTCSDYNKVFELYESHPESDLKGPSFNFGNFIKDFVALCQRPVAPKRDFEGQVINDISKDLLIIRHLAFQKLLTYSSAYREVSFILSRHQVDFGQSLNDLTLLYELGSALELSSNLYFEDKKTDHTRKLDYLKKIELQLKSNFFPFLLSIAPLLKFSRGYFQPLVDKALKLSPEEREVQFRKVCLFLERVGLEGTFPIIQAIERFSALTLDQVIQLGEKSQLFFEKYKVIDLKSNTLENLMVVLSHPKEVLNDIVLEIEAVQEAFDFNSKVNIAKALLPLSAERRGTILELIKRHLREQTVNKEAVEIATLEQLFLFLAKQEIDFEKLIKILRLSHEARVNIIPEYLDILAKMPIEAITIYSLKAFEFPPDIRAEAAQILSQIDQNEWLEFIEIYYELQQIFPKSPTGFQGALNSAKELYQPGLAEEILKIIDEVKVKTY